MLSHPLLLALTGVLPLSFLLRDGGPLLRQGNVFLQDYGQPPYSRRLIFCLMALVWLVGGGIALLTGPMSTLSTAHGLQTWGLMLFSLNMMALDAQERWLPLCFTLSFWGAGVLLTLLPGTLLTFDAAVVNSLLVFVLLRLVYRVLAQKRPDALGLGRCASAGRSVRLAAPCRADLCADALCGADLLPGGPFHSPSAGPLAVAGGAAGSFSLSRLTY